MTRELMQIPEKLLPLMQKKKRFKIIVGGRGSGKSVSVAKLLAAQVHQTGCKILAAREHMNSLSDSVHSTLWSQITAHKMDGFTELASEIRHSRGGSIVYRGLSRNPEGLKSMDNVKFAWIEEAQTISEKSLELLTPSVRADDSEIWMSANPRSSKDPFSLRFLKPFEKELKKHGYYEDDLHIIIICNYIDNPWFTKELEQERLYDLEHKSRAQYDHTWLGAYDDDVEGSIIKAEWFDACIDAHKKVGFKAQGIEVVAHDPSDLGSDSKGLARRHGCVLLDVQEKEDGDINEGGDWAADYALSKQADVFIYDLDGMGVGLRRQFNESFLGKRIDVQGYRGSSTKFPNPDAIYEMGADSQPKTVKETFRNIRAWAYWTLRDRVYRTYQAVEKGKNFATSDLISFSSGIEQLELFRSELCRIPIKNNGMGMIQIMSKPEMAKIGIVSPNLADSVAMAFSVQSVAAVAFQQRTVRQVNQSGYF